jgi:hypothetical protein
MTRRVLLYTLSRVQSYLLGRVEQHPFTFNCVGMSSSQESDTSEWNITSSAMTDSSVVLPLNWEPVKLKAKKGGSQYWVVENDKNCVGFCKTQLKVCTSQYIANSNRLRISNCLNGHFKQRNSLIVGQSSTKYFESKMVHHTCGANIANWCCLIPIEMQTKVLRV